jgi:hypothetical protein
LRWPGGRRLRPTTGRCDVTAKVTENLVDAGIVLGQLEGHPVLFERFGQFTPPSVNFAEAPDGGQILWSGTQHVAEFGVRRVQFAGLE